MFLYLYFNGIHPVACSINPYLVHYGKFIGSSNTLVHDLVHIDNYKRIKNDTEYHNNLSSAYSNIISEYNNEELDDDLRKLLIVVLFFYVHEITIGKIKCGESIETIHKKLGIGGYGMFMELLEGMINNPAWGPQRYSFSPIEIQDMKDAFAKKSFIPLLKYREYARLLLMDGINQLCQFYPDI